MKLIAKCEHSIEVDLKEGVTEEQALADPEAQKVIQWHEEHCSDAK